MTKIITDVAFMFRKAIYIVVLFIGSMSYAQECPDFNNPNPGATNVPVTTDISWDEVVGVNGYIISLGTTPGGGEIVNEQAVGLDTTFQPPLGLPESTQIYATLTLFFFDLPDIVCPSISFTTENVTTIPECTMMTSPVNGAVNVNISTNISWSYAPRATGYRITIGTAPGAGDIVNNLDVGNTLSYNPPADFPNDTEIFVRIDPYNENGAADGCPEESFTTASLGDPPGCTTLIDPADGAVNVTLSPNIEWTPVPGATGYKVFIGSSPINNDVLDGVIYMVTSISVLDFEPNITYYVRIVPFNAAGDAQNCPQESFSTILGCGPFFDDNGNLINFNPTATLPEQIGLCGDAVPQRLQAPDLADGYRWFQIDQFGDEELLSETDFVDISEEGLYRYEIYNILNQGEATIECAVSVEFTVTISSAATIDFIRKAIDEDLFTILAEVSGQGDYEFSITSEAGPYQDLQVFAQLPPGSYVLYVRDKNGCGVVQQPFELLPPPTGFPPYFSPNGDGINDFWQYVPPEENPLPVRVIYIYDRFGKLLDRINPNTQGWDGLYDNTPMPFGGYWYQAFLRDGNVVRGNFSLIR